MSHPKYNYILPKILPKKIADLYCYLCRLDNIDDNIEFRRTFCEKNILLNKKSKKTDYTFFLKTPGIYEFGQLFDGTNFYRKSYLEYKTDGTIKHIDKSYATDSMVIESERLQIINAKIAEENRAKRKYGRRFKKKTE